MSDAVVSLAAERSARRSRDGGPPVWIFRCLACGCYSFKLIEIDGEDNIACANCEAWIVEFDLRKNREIS